MQDLKIVIECLEKSGYDVVGLVGHSRGANIILHCAALLSNLSFVVAIAPRFHMLGGLEKHSPDDLQHLQSLGFLEMNVKSRGMKMCLKVSKDEVEKFVNFNNSTVCQIPAETGVLLIHGKMDINIPCSDLENFKELLPSADMTYYETDHFFTNVQQELIENVKNWIENKLRA